MKKLGAMRRDPAKNVQATSVKMLRADAWLREMPWAKI